MLVGEYGDVEGGPEKFLESLRTKKTEEVREELLKFVGVGRKVADCVMLMSMDKVRGSPRPYELTGSLLSLCGGLA